MSKTVDERVVEMRFDNAQFERNVQTSMSTLDKLKQKLNLSGASKGLEDVGSAAKKIDMSGLSSGIETVRAKFSALEVMGVTALANITNSAVNAGKRIVSAITTDPIKSGFQEYETQMNAVQTILANTQKEGTNVRIVNKALDELNEYADKTIYNFTEMTRNIGTFTAAGVKLDTSVSAIKGIANLAAVSGSSSQQASTAMYQLSQAIASGTVKLMDWNSVVNAGMGGQVFQDALIRTSEHLQTGAKAAIDAKGSFRESLQTGWLTTEVLTETLDQFSTAADTQEEYEAAVQKFVEQGYTQEEAKQMADMAKTAGEAATKVKTFTQLIDTLKEALGSGWTQTWRLIIGDFEEARTLWTEVSDVLSGIINESAEARNNMIQGWADLGGRTALIDAFKNTFEAVSKIITPISKAFREIFPRTTSEQLYNLTEGLKKFTEHLIISDESVSKLKSTFKGIFSVLDIGLEFFKSIGKGAIDLVKNLTGIHIGFLDASSSMGDYISNFRDSIKETDAFGKAVKKVTDFLSKGINGIKEFGSSLKQSFFSADYSGFVGVFKGIWNIVKQVSSGIVKALSSVTEGITKIFNGSNFFEVLNNGIFAGVLVYIAKFVKGLSGAFDEGSGILENIKGILDDVRDCFKAYQDQLKAGTLLKLAGAIGILAASLFVISTIDGNKLASALTGITVLFVELVGALAVLEKIDKTSKGTGKAVTLMIGLSAAVLILSGAMKRLAGLDWEGIAKGLVGVGGLMLELSIFLRTFKFDGKLTGVAIGITVLSSALLILSKAVKEFGGMEWSEIGKGLTSIGALLLELAVFTKLAGNTKRMVSIGTGMVLLGASMKIFASVMKDFSGMSWSEVGKGLTAMGGALAELAIAMKLMPKNMISIGTGLVIVGAALKIVYSAMSGFSGMSWGEVGKGLTAMGGALAELAIALNLMKNTLAGSAALLIAAGALAILTPILKTLGSMSWGEIGKGLITLAGAFTVIGVAGLLLKAVIPSILGLAASFALLGVASVGIGAGLALIAAGIASLATALSAGVTVIVAGLSAIIIGILDLVPAIARELGKAIVEFAKVIGECAPQLAEACVKLIYEVLKSLAIYTPKIVDCLMVLLIDVINSLADHLPELIVAVMNFIGKFFQGIVDALNDIDTTNLLKGILAVGLMTALMAALSAIVSLIPSAMAGMLGVGAVIAEMAIVLAAIGGLAQIPGLKWLIGEGGNLLQKIGTAIGQFVGGIVGGVAKGMTSTLPEVGKKLSDFMTNIKPFIEGARDIDESMFNGIKALIKIIMELTAADLLSRVTSWVTGGSSLSNFAKDLIPFGEAMKKYADTVSGIDNKAVMASAIAANALSVLANNLPNSGGLVSWFAGDNELGEFAKQLEPFGKAMKAYADSVAGIDTEAVTASANAAKTLSELANNLPNSGGLVSLFSGDNSLSSFAEQLEPFGKAMKVYADSVAGIDAEAVVASANAAKTLSELANNLPNTGGLVSWFTGDNGLDTFGYQLAPFGESMKAYADSIAGINTEAVTASANAAKTLSELAANLPNSGGLVALFTGENSLASFGYQLAPFGESMKAYADSISGIDVEAVTASANAAKSLSELAANLPNSGGLVALFTGENSLSSFGYQLAPFGAGMKAYADSITGIDTEAVTASANAAKSLSELAANLPNSGGVVALFTGENNISTFGNMLAPFGKGMKDYADSIAGINPEAVTASANAAKSLAELANNLPNSGGLASLFTGDNDLGEFAKKLKPFGEGMKTYGDSVAGIDTTAITASASAAKALVNVANALSNSGGLMSIFTGESDISSLGKKLIPFGQGMKSYGAAVVGIDITAITASASAAKALVNVANSLSNSGGLASLFTGESDLTDLGKKLVPFGKSLKEYSDAVAGVNPTGVINSASAAKRLVELINSMSGINSKGVKSFKDGIDALAKTNIDGFVKAFSGSSAKIREIGSDLTEALTKGFTANQYAITSAASKVISTMEKAMSSKTTDFVSAGTQLMEKFISGLSDKSSKISSAITSGLKTAVSDVRGYYSKFYDAGSYLVSGFESGISANSYKAAAKAKAMAKAAYDAAKDELDINSPSKVFRRLAYCIPEGFAQGIDRMGKCVENSSTNMAKNAIKGTSDALTKISDLINGDIDAQPTIRPVLDLSDVKSGAGTLSAMFNNGGAIGLRANVNAVSSLMNQNRQNGTNSDVISALDKLNKSINNLERPSYVINGVTYDDGSNVSNAVESLVHAAKIERRI